MASTGVELRSVQARTINIHGVSVGGTADDLVADLRAGLLAAADLAGLQRSTIIDLAQRLNKDDALDFSQAVKELERAIEVALDVLQGERRSNDDAFVNAVLAQVAERVRSDDLDGGAEAIDAALALIEAGHRRSQTALLDEGIKIHTLRRDAAAVARRIEMLVAVNHPTDRPAWLPEFQERFYSFMSDGEARGINFSLLVAIELARWMLATACNDGERWTATVLLGNALWTLGERESGTARLEEAVAVYRAALQKLARARVPLDWATTQNNLGNALSTLGERESGTARLEEAVAAYRAALREWTRERVPLQWAATQNNLGNALRSLGERESGTARLEEAVAAFCAALQERTRERVPLQWARTQSNLGNALLALGSRESGTARLEEAVASYRAALQERTRERVPLDWAMTQNNLGTALTSLGERGGGTARLEEAVTTYRTALQERTRERVPLQWAVTQNNLGIALWMLGERESGTARLEEAVATYYAALQERTRELVPFQWARTRENLAEAFLSLATRMAHEARRAYLADALIAVDGALAVYREGNAAYYAEKAERLRADILAAQAEARAR